jgi:hypothetical protein
MRAAPTTVKDVPNRRSLPEMHIGFAQAEAGQRDGEGRHEIEQPVEQQRRNQFGSIEGRQADEHHRVERPDGATASRREGLRGHHG